MKTHKEGILGENFHKVEMQGCGTIYVQKDESFDNLFRGGGFEIDTEYLKKYVPMMQTVTTCMPKKETIWEKIKKEEAKHIQKCKENQEKAIIQGLQSCGYQYDEVLQYLKNKQRFEMNRLQKGYMFDGYAEYVLYDSYTQRAFILITESSTMNIEGCECKAVSQMQIISYKNRQVPYNYHR